MTAPRDDDELPERFLAEVRDVTAPPPTPREEMWAAITAERERRRQARRATRIRWRAGLALAATLVLGIGIGRLVSPRGPLPPATAAPPEPSTAYRVAAGQYLARTEVLLTDFRAESRAGRLDSRFLATAQDLLATTRLMLDSPAADDPQLRLLLQDLELVLAQIAQLPAETGRKADVDLINQGMTRHSVLTRLRAMTPARGAPARIEGVL